MGHFFKSDEESSEEENENSEIEMDQDASDDEEDETMNGENESSQPSRVYLPGQESNPDVTLECDESAYSCFHTFKTGKHLQLKRLDNFSFQK